MVIGRLWYYFHLLAVQIENVVNTLLVTKKQQQKTSELRFSGGGVKLNKESFILLGKVHNYSIHYTLTSR